MAEYYLIFGPNAIQYLLPYSLWGLILRPWIITFLLRLIFDSGYRGLLFTSTTHLEAGPHFTWIWCLCVLNWCFIEENGNSSDFAFLINPVKIIDVKIFSKTFELGQIGPQLKLFKNKIDLQFKTVESGQPLLKKPQVWRTCKIIIAIVVYFDQQLGAMQPICFFRYNFGWNKMCMLVSVSGATDAAPCFALENLSIN